MKTKELVKFDVETAVIVTLDNKYKDIQITDGKSYAFVMNGLREYRELRLAVIEGHKTEKHEALEHCNFLDAEKRRILERLEPGEDYLKHIRLTWDEDKAAIKAAKETAERMRIEAIQEKINSIRTLGTVHNTSSPAIEERIFLTGGIEISKEVYGEFVAQAIECQKEAIAALEKALSESIQFEKEEAARKAEAERLEKVRKEQEAAQAKIDEENRKIELKQHELEEKERKAEVRKAQQEFERQATIKAEQEAKEKAEREEKERIERAVTEAKEKARQAEMAPDKEKLIKFADELLDIGMPDIKSAKGRKILSDADDRRCELAEDIRAKAKKL